MRGCSRTNSRAIAKVKQNSTRINPAHRNPKEDMITEARVATGDFEQTVYRIHRLSSLTVTCISDEGSNFTRICVTKTGHATLHFGQSDVPSARTLCNELESNRKGQAKHRADKSRALQTTSTPTVLLAVIHLNQHCF